jgi:structure-specific endonuclease subunit SLX1
MKKIGLNLKLIYNTIIRIQMDSYCYMLYTDDLSKTYVGATTDPDRRLRQHNKEISGGARATGISVQQGLTWQRACYIKGIPEWRSALQIEWRWKHIGRTHYKHIRNPIHRRLYSLKTLLSLDKPTEKAIPYDAYPNGPPEIVWESDELSTIYDNISPDS